MKLVWQEKVKTQGIWKLGRLSLSFTVFFFCCGKICITFTILSVSKCTFQWHHIRSSCGAPLATICLQNPFHHRNETFSPLKTNRPPSLLWGSLLICFNPSPLWASETTLSWFLWPRDRHFRLFWGSLLLALLSVVYMLQASSVAQSCSRSLFVSGLSVFPASALPLGGFAGLNNVPLSAHPPKTSEWDLTCIRVLHTELIEALEMKSFSVCHEPCIQWLVFLCEKTHRHRGEARWR